MRLRMARVSANMRALEIAARWFLSAEARADVGKVRICASNKVDQHTEPQEHAARPLKLSTKQNVMQTQIQTMTEKIRAVAAATLAEGELEGGRRAMAAIWSTELGALKTGDVPFAPHEQPRRADVH